MCDGRKGLQVVECNVCGHLLDELELEGAIELSPIQAKLMAMAVSEASDLSPEEIVKRWNELGFVNRRSLACSF